MVKREPFEHGIFEDRETVEKYNKEVKKWMQNVAKSFVAVAKKWGIEKGKTLDVGTGTGLLAIGFAKAFPDMEVVGLDLSEEALQVARENVQKSGVENISFEKGDAQAMPFEDGTFDLVISSNTLHLIENPVKMFNEIQRMLKFDGKFFISDFKRSWLAIFSKHFRASYTPDEIRELLRQSELKRWEVKDRLFWVSISSKE
ncbi:MAG: class I SAM-dependent methyltransferase [Theionarchaea archaeon]|nr:class I SAM-dependent methyltransferase [Theionarchaea archaeon]